MMLTNDPISAFLFKETVNICFISYYIAYLSPVVTEDYQFIYFHIYILKYETGMTLVCIYNQHLNAVCPYNKYITRATFKLPILNGLALGKNELRHGFTSSSVADN
jgi:hypothetical protein